MASNNTFMLDEPVQKLANTGAENQTQPFVLAEPTSGGFVLDEPTSKQGMISNITNSLIQGSALPVDMYQNIVQGESPAAIQARRESQFPTTPGITSDVAKMVGSVGAPLAAMAGLATAGVPAAGVLGAGAVFGTGAGLYQGNQRIEELEGTGVPLTQGQKLGIQGTEAAIGGVGTFLGGKAGGVALSRGKSVFDTAANLGKMAAARQGLGKAALTGAAQEAAINAGSVVAADVAAQGITGAKAEDIYGTPSQFGYKLGIAGLGGAIPGGLFRRSAQKRVNKQADWAQEITDTMEFGLDKDNNEYMRPRPTEKTVDDYAESVEERAARMAQTPVIPRADIHNMLPEEYAALPPEQKTDSGRPIYAYLTPAEQKVMDARPNSRRSQILAEKASFRKDWAEHKAAVESALAAGETVPDKVLAEYPSLRKAQEKKVKEAAKAQKTLDDLKQAELDREAKLAQDVTDAWEREELRKVAEQGAPGLSVKYFGKHKTELFPIYKKSRAERKAAEKDAAAQAKLDAKNAEIEKKALDAQAKVAADGIAAAKAKAERDVLIPRMAESISSGEIILDVEFGPHKDLLQKYKTMMKDRANEITEQIKRDKAAEVLAAKEADRRESEAGAQESARADKTIGEWFRSKLKRKGALNVADQSVFWDHVQRALPAHLRDVGHRASEKDLYSTKVVMSQMPIIGNQPWKVSNKKSKTGKPRVSMDELWNDFKHEYPELFQEIDPADPAGAKLESENMKKFFDLVLKNSPEPLLKDRAVGLGDDDALAQEAAWQKREAMDRRREAEAAGYNVTGNPEEFQAARKKKESPLPDIKGATNKSPFDTKDTQLADELDAGNIPDMVGPDLAAEKADLEYSTRKGSKTPLPEYDSPEQIVDAHSQAVQGIALDLMRKGVFSAVIINKGQLYHPTERYWDAEQGREMAPKVNAHLMFNAPGEAPALMLSPNVDLNTVWHEVGHAAYEIVGADDPLMLDLAKVFNGDLEQSFNAFGDIVSGKFFQANGPMDLAHRTMLIMRKLIGKAIRLPGGMDRLQLDAVMSLQNTVTRSDYELFKNRTTKSLVDDLNRYNAPRMSQKVQASRMAGMLTTDPDAFVKKTARDLYGAPSEYHADRARTILADPILVDKLLAKAQDKDAGISPAESLALVALNNQVARVIAYAKKYGTKDNIKATQISLREYVLALSAAGTKWGQSGKFMQMPLTLETTKMMIEHQLGKDLTPAQMKLLEDVARNPEELAKMINKIQDPTAKDFIGNWVRSSLLLGGAIPNSIWYNTLMLGFKVAQYPTRAGLDTLLSVTGLRGLVAGEKTRQYLWRDVAEYYKGLAKGFMTVPAKQKALIESTELGHYVNQNLWADWAYNLKKEAETLTGGKYISNRMKAALAKIGHIQGYSIKLMELMDRQFRNAAFEAEVQTRASRWARSQPGAQIGNVVFEKARKLYLDSLENDPDLLALIHNSANSIAFMDEGGPILNGLKSLRNAVDEVSPIIPLGTAIVPFMHTAGRAMNFTFDIMPGVGLAKGLTRKMNQRAKIKQWEYRQGKDAEAAEATGKSTPEEIEAIRNKPWNKEKVDMLEVLANQVLGTGLAAALLAWADGKDDQGRPLVVGKTPIAPGLKAVFQTGMEYRPYSVQIPQGLNPTGQPQYLEMSRFGSFAPLLQTLTALKDTLLNPKEPYESGAKMLQDFLQEFSKLTLDSSFLEQPSKLLSGTAPLDRLADSVKGFVPFSEAGRLMGRAATLYLQGEGQTQMSRLIGAGSLQRSALGDVKGETLAEEVGLVGLRMASRMVGPDVITHVAVPTAKQLGILTDSELANKIQAEKVGVWGGSWKLRTSVLSDLIAPFRTWTPKDDLTTKELYRLGRGINPPGETIKIDPRTGRISPKGMEMTMPFEMYDYVARGVGQKRKEVMDRLMSTTSWNSLSDSRKLALINHRMQSLEPLRLRLARTYLRDNPALQELLAVQGKQVAGSQESLR